MGLENHRYTEECLRDISKQLIGFPITLERDGPVIGHITKAVVNVSNQSVLAVIKMDDGEEVEMNAV